MNLRRVWLVIGWLLVASLVWGSLTSSPPGGPKLPYADKVEHVFGYALLMAWFWPLYGRVGRYWCAAGFIALGIALEFLQGAGGVRRFEWADMVADAVGVLGVLALCHWGACRRIEPLRRRLAAS